MADHKHRQWNSKVVNEIELPSWHNRIKQLIDQQFDLPMHHCQRFGGKRFLHQPPQSGVFGWIAEQRHVRHGSVDDIQVFVANLLQGCQRVVAAGE